jgi:HEPN domain-containing protein/predicted nucleotidyltransferase
MDTSGATVARAPQGVARRRALLLSELERVRAVLSRNPSIQRVVVFGSVASGDVHEWSDLDLMVVQETSARFLDRAQALTDLTRPMVGTQFIVYTPDELDEMAARPFVRHEILKKGKTLPVDAKGDAERSLSLATDDLRMTRLAAGEEMWGQACFHAQQCVEKCLMALLARAGLLLPRTHVILDLWLALPPATRDAVADLEARLQRLDRFYIPTRYPDAVAGSLAEGFPTRDDAAEALSAADDCLARSRAIAERPGPSANGT